MQVREAAPATPVASPGVGASPLPGVSSMAAPSPRPTRKPVPLPSLEPGEVITWVKLDRPRFAIGEIVVGSFAIAGAVALAALVIGLVIGQWRSRHRSAHGAGGLKLR
jgi:hypothetical protein